ncbi:DUF1570 domain-containing protein [Alienimonas californiensis]|uniref:DUF1570 domain-containing protein n=1 Tax=Alienimonas californiensis TaxID=2527989 RepID=A0A517P4Z1_9PLAN|nr:DUF1570 domain-containing protein [Alienimonas californiensis]QDT14452.1 hypothetical protein CA12_05250 [Alienimonas californiensis]
MHVRPRTADRFGAVRPFLTAAGALCFAVLASGCASLTGGTDAAPGLGSAGLAPLTGPPTPGRHSVRVENLIVKSDSELSADDPLIADLRRLRADVTKALALPEATKDVTVFLFADEPAYRRFLEYRHPGLPPRRAYFVGTGTALHVYTYLGDRTAEDLRHETVHGLLHASLPGVPLWLDEGLAEYFETPTPGAVNGDYPELLARAVAGGWRPDLARLEAMDDFAALSRQDYAESWAWVHLMMSGDRTVLLDHLASLGPGGTSPVSLTTRLSADRPSAPGPLLTAHIATLLGSGVLHAGR